MLSINAGEWHVRSRISAKNDVNDFKIIVPSVFPWFGAA